LSGLGAWVGTGIAHDWKRNNLEGGALAETLKKENKQKLLNKRPAR
jgi:hypothetical protein